MPCSWQLTSRLDVVESLLIDLPSRKTDSKETLYELLINTRASEHCNDASLCLQDIDASYQAIHPNDRDDELDKLAAFAVQACNDFLVTVLRGVKGTRLLIVTGTAQTGGSYTKESVRSISENAFAVLASRTYLGRHIQLFLQNLNASFKLTHERTRLCAAISELSGLFLSLATAFEEELGRLMPTSPDSQTTILSTEEDLASEFSRVAALLTRTLDNILLTYPLCYILPGGVQCHFEVSLGFTHYLPPVPYSLSQLRLRVLN